VHGTQIEINMTFLGAVSQTQLNWAQLSWEADADGEVMEMKMEKNMASFRGTHMTHWHQDQQQGQKTCRACPVENMKNVKQKSGKNFSNLKLPTKKNKKPKRTTRKCSKERAKGKEQGGKGCLCVKRLPNLNNIQIHCQNDI